MQPAAHRVGQHPRLNVRSADVNDVEAPPTLVDERIEAVPHALKGGIPRGKHQFGRTHRSNLGPKRRSPEQHGNCKGASSHGAQVPVRVQRPGPCLLFGLHWA